MSSSLYFSRIELTHTNASNKPHYERRLPNMFVPMVSQAMRA
jgi:hypothetical protein